MEAKKFILFIIIHGMINAAVFAAEEDSTSSRSAFIKTRENKRLEGHVVKRLESPSLMSCSHSCLKNAWCTSTNFKTPSEKNSKGACELNKHGAIDANTEFRDQQGVTFSVLLKGCLMTGCLNGGSCVPDEKEQTFSCSCQNPWTGEKCETKIGAGYALLFPRKGTTDYVITHGMPSLTAVTVCFWMKTADTGNYGTPLSYAVSGSSNELLLHDYRNFELYVGGTGYSSTYVSANDGKWHHICATWENTAGSWKLFKDGKVAASGKGRKKGHVIPGGGALVLGQDQDSVGGGFEAIQSFIGEMTGVNVWDHVITDQEIMHMSKSCLTGVGNVFQWRDFKDHVKGSVKIIHPSC